MFPGFNKSKRRGTISRGDWDKDEVRNRKDCEPLNYKRQDACKHMYHSVNVNKKGNEVCILCGEERPETERDIKKMFSLNNNGGYN